MDTACGTCRGGRRAAPLGFAICPGTPPRGEPEGDLPERLDGLVYCPGQYPPAALRPHQRRGLPARLRAQLPGGGTGRAQPAAGPAQVSRRLGGADEHRRGADRHALSCLHRRRQGRGGRLDALPGSGAGTADSGQRRGALAHRYARSRQPCSAAKTSANRQPPAIPWDASAAPGRSPAAYAFCWHRRRAGSAARCWQSTAAWAACACSNRHPQ